MNNLRVNEIVNICKGRILTQCKNIEVMDFSKDTRTIKQGDLHIAIKGDNIDGNNFIKEALDKGAIGCLVDKEIENDLIKKYNDKAIIKVENTIKAIQQIAKYKRSLYNIPVIAVTGSVRKNKYKRCNCKCII